MLKTLRVLIVEDSEDDTELLLRELRRGGYDPVYVRVEDAEAMQAALDEQEWDVILSDYAMPRFSAPAALHLLQESGLDLPFIIISGTIGDEVGVAALKAGAHDFLIKGQLARLIPAIERELRDAEVRRDRMQAERVLRDRESYFRALIENVSDIIITLDATGKIIYASPAVTHILGYLPEEYEGSNAFDLIHPDDRPEVYTLFAQLFQQPTISNATQFRTQHQDGSWCWLEATGRSLPSEAGVEAGVIVLRDITARKQAEKEREQLLGQILGHAREVQFIVDTVPEGIFMLSEAGNIRLTNPIAKEFLELLAPEWENGRLTHLGTRPLIKLLTSPPKGLWHELKYNGRFFEIIARPVESGPEQRGWVFVMRDVTQERQIQQQVQSQERLAAVGQLAAGIAHDFNNSLAVIRLYTDMLTRTADLIPRNQERLQTISMQTRRAADLIQQILDFSRQSLMERQPLDLLLFLKEITALLKRTLPEDIQIDLTAAENSEYIIHADSSRIQQAILNLAFNARDAMPQGGVLTIRLTVLQLASDIISPVSGMPAGEWVQVDVSDNGTGIPTETVAHIFEPFFSTKERGKGTGLGLAQVYGIVQQHEGFIDVTTELNQGTTFHLYFPTYSGDEYDAPQLLDETVPMGQGQLILIVEDEETVRQALVESLTLLNYKVIEAENAREALALLDQHHRKIALVLSDIIMPTMGGIALFHTLHERDLDIPFIMVTGYAVERDMEGLRAMGLAGWLTKPLDLAKLARLMHQVLT